MIEYYRNYSISQALYSHTVALILLSSICHIPINNFFANPTSTLLILSCTASRLVANFFATASHPSLSPPSSSTATSFPSLFLTTPSTITVSTSLTLLCPNTATTGSHSATPHIAGDLPSTTTKSAKYPTLTLPIFPCIPTALAPPTVARLNTSLAPASNRSGNSPLSNSLRFPSCRAKSNNVRASDRILDSQKAWLSTPSEPCTPLCRATGQPNPICASEVGVLETLAPAE